MFICSKALSSSFYFRVYKPITLLNKTGDGTSSYVLELGDKCQGDLRFSLIVFLKLLLILLQFTDTAISSTLFKAVGKYSGKMQ